MVCSNLKFRTGHNLLFLEKEFLVLRHHLNERFKNVIGPTELKL